MSSSCNSRISTTLQWKGSTKARTARAIGSRTKLMQHWADRIDHWLDPKKVMRSRRRAGLTAASEGKGHTFESYRVRQFFLIFNAVCARGFELGLCLIPASKQSGVESSPSAESLATDDVGRKLAGPRAKIDSLNSWTGALGQPMPRYVIYSFA